MTLKHFLHEFGITTYEGFLNRCERMGVTPSDEDEFRECFPDELPTVNNPLEGIVVIEPLKDEPYEPDLRSGFVSLGDPYTDSNEFLKSTKEDSDDFLKKSKKKKVNT